MNIFRSLLLTVALVSLAACQSPPPPAAPARTPLSFYEAQDHYFDGSTTIDRGEYLYPLYIAATPDLELSRLASVTSRQTPVFNYTKRSTSDSPASGIQTTTSQTTTELTTLSLTLLPGDVQKLADFTTRAHGHYFVLMLGHTTLLIDLIIIPNTRGQLDIPLDQSPDDSAKKALTAQIQSLAN